MAMPDAKHNRGEKIKRREASGGTEKPEKQASDLARAIADGLE
jgi:hypothetical protein